MDYKLYTITFKAFRTHVTTCNINIHENSYYVYMMKIFSSDYKYGSCSLTAETMRLVLDYSSFILIIHFRGKIYQYQDCSSHACLIMNLLCFFCGYYNVFYSIQI